MFKYVLASVFALGFSAASFAQEPTSTETPAATEAPATTGSETTTTTETTAKDHMKGAKAHKAMHKMTKKSKKTTEEEVK